MNDNRNDIVRESFAPRFALVVIVIIVVTIITLVLIQRLKPSAISVFLNPQEQYTSGQAITSSVGNVTVYIPKDSTSLEGSISIIPREPNLFTPVNESEWNRPQTVSIEFQTSQGPTEVNFPNLIQICFGMTEAQWQGFLQQPGRFQVQYYAEEKNPSAWEPLPMTNHPERYQLCGQTQHLSLYALAIKSEMIVPITGPTTTSILGATAPSGSSIRIPELNPNTGSSDSDPNVRPTDPLPTAPPPTNPPATDPPPVETGPTDPLPTDPPPTSLPTDPPPSETVPTDPPPTNPPQTDPSATDLPYP